MQTMKTAAIVVLLMTIIYSAYVSLTTPPEPLPPEVENMLVMSEDGEFSIDAGLPESLGELAMNVDPGDASASGSPGVTVQIPSEIAASAGPLTGELPVMGSLSDNSESLTGGVATANLSAPNVAAAEGYPNTGQSFEMPIPKGLDVKFQTASSVKPSMPGQWPSEAATDSSPTSTGDPNVGVANAIRTADRQFAEDKLKEALATLSLFYHTPSLSGEQRSDLLSRLDPLAREVIYSKRHLLEQPYRVGQNETLMQVAARFEVPWQLLANINQVDDPVTVLPGTELKVVRGPFRADIDLVAKELTLFLDDLYAGRFPIEVGPDPSPKPGTFTVQDKQNARTYYDAAGSPVPPDSPDNPYGNVWIDLGGQICIHGSPSTTNPTDKGCISLAADYAKDLYGILSQGSSVTIRR